ncbi:hypothetical protein EPUS_02372 [Endocarpon pusillum Z07020]|uniref:BTB domain-containing protein n=1 Tax=Endocarpon pusillum (strain Z07020 / HMAS-L-300199) TaxID=1263415 RepID=U1HKS1_ENDPU|nr:uncharacterized protein EPUS_02372 [Endocarpon pusillum Z07020]ERF70850.1 hypothetical protein EPUS_02372 [Endocarpon pusillum Z07020]
MAQPATPVGSTSGSAPLLPASQTSAPTWTGFTGPSRTASSTSAQANAYLMPASPAKSRRHSSEGHRPKMSKATGSKPACLVNASVTYCGNNQIYAFGGFDQFTDEVYNHVLKLDLYTLNWSLVDNYGDIPGVRMGHSASLYQGHKLLVYGGENEHREYLSDVVILDLKTMYWTQPDVQGPHPRGRARHASVVYEDKLFIIGGLTGETNYILDDICYLDLKTWTWSRTWSFAGRFDHSAWIWGGRLWIFGGLGPEMERSTEIWWLDLKGSPSLGMPSMDGFSDPNGLGRSISGSMPSNGTTSNFNPITNAYTANSGSVHVRSSRKDRPNAPGAISSLKFLSGPHVPPQSSGTHFHVYSSGTLLDFVTPAATIRSTECNLSSLELDSLRWQKLVEGPELFQPGYRWHYCTINEDGTKAWLLGSQIDTSTSSGQEAQLSEVLAVDLRKYGLLGNDLVYQSNSEQRRILASERETSISQGLGTDLASMFDIPPDSGSMTDFTITANADDSDICSGSSTLNSPTEPAETRFSIGSTASAPLYLSSNTSTSPPIHVHKMILQARWPHFKRLYAAKMAEFHNQKLHIPEPYSVVRAFLYYLYTDSIAPHSVYCQDLTDVAGMLVMANLYDMPKLRLLCVHRLSRELDVEHAAIVWERAGRTNEEWLKHRAARFCLSNWGRVVRTEGFRGLSRGSLMELCEVVDMEGRVVNGEELEAVVGNVGWCADGGSFAVGGLGRDGVGNGRSRARARGRRMSDIDDGEEGDEDGMEIS